MTADGLRIHKEDSRRASHRHLTVVARISQKKMADGTLQRRLRDNNTQERTHLIDINAFSHCVGLKAGITEFACISDVSLGAAAIKVAKDPVRARSSALAGIGIALVAKRVEKWDSTINAAEDRPEFTNQVKKGVDPTGEPQKEQEHQGQASGVDLLHLVSRTFFLSILLFHPRLFGRAKSPSTFRIVWMNDEKGVGSFGL